MKQPCIECKRYIGVYSLSPYLRSHYCESKRINGVDGTHYLHECCWYRHTPFCRFELKVVSE